VNRRELISLLGGAATVPSLPWPLTARAEQPVPLVGFLTSGGQRGYLDFLASFRQGLAELGFVDGQNVALEYRFAEGHFERLPALANELIARRVAILVTSGIGSALPARAASATTPLLFLAGDDPVKAGLVASLGRPGGNATGMAWLTSVLLAKRLEIARELVPADALIGVLINPTSPEFEPQLRDIESAARALGQQIRIVNASTVNDFDAALAALTDQQAKALVVSNDAFFNTERDRIVALAALHRLPSIYDRREYAAAGGLITYGTPYPFAYRELGRYAGRILKGAKPADLPVQQPTRFELVINLKTAKALGLTVPRMLLALADEVIE
jgi:putative tryptophan/tyrosine transport system substrate-binding protein